MTGADSFFLLMGAILVFAMHGGFAFLEAGTVRGKNQVNALVKIMSDFAISTLCYCTLGYFIAYGAHFFHTAAFISGGGEGFDEQGYTLVRMFFLATFAAAVPAIISGGIAERARFGPQLAATGALTILFYPVLEGVVWNGNYGIQDLFTSVFGHAFRDFAGSGVVHAMGGFAALAAVWLLGARRGRFGAGGQAFPPSSIVWLALGSWLLCIGWFGFNVMTAGSLDAFSGLVAANSLLALAGGIIGGLVIGRGDPGFVHNGALAGLVAVCAGSDIMHPAGACLTGLAAGALFVYFFNLMQNRWQIDDVLGVWPLHGLAGLWGIVAAGIFGQTALGGLGEVSFFSQLAGAVLIALYAFASGLVVYGLLKNRVGIRLSAEEEDIGSDLAIHKISARPGRAGA